MVLFISVICSVLYIIFLLIRVAYTPVFWFTYWHPVFFKPFLFLWKLLHRFKFSCLTLFSPLILQDYYNFVTEISFAISLSICFTDCNCLSYLIFCNCNSSRNFSFKENNVISTNPFVYWRRVSRTTLYALSSHFVICKKFLLQAYTLQISLKLNWANSNWHYLKLQLNNKTIVIILRPWPNKVFGREYINQICKAAKTSHSYLIQTFHAILKLSLILRWNSELLLAKTLKSLRKTTQY